VGDIIPEWWATSSGISTKAEQQRAHWQLAVEILINCAEGRDLLFHARVAVLRALHHDEPDPAATPRRKQTKAFKVVR
jgi:uncharacterized protein YndB with AHSA1/START domain